MLGIYHEIQRESLEIVCAMKKEYGEEYGKKDQSTPIRMVESTPAIFSYIYVVMRA